MRDGRRRRALASMPDASDDANARANAVVSSAMATNATVTNAATTNAATTNSDVNPAHLMRRAESMMEARACRRAREEAVRDGAPGAIVRGAAKPGEDDWCARADASEVEGDGARRDDGDARRDGPPPSPPMGSPTRDGVQSARRVVSEDEDEDEDGEEADAEVADDAFKSGKAALQRRDFEEALRLFAYAEARLPRRFGDAREKLLKTIEQTRALIEQVVEEEEKEEDGGGKQDEDAECYDAAEAYVDDDEFDSATDDGWSETDASLADDAYRTAVWLLKTALEEDRTPDKEKIRDLLERARQFCPPSHGDAVDRIDSLLDRLDQY